MTQCKCRMSKFNVRFQGTHHFLMIFLVIFGSIIMDSILLNYSLL